MTGKDLFASLGFVDDELVEEAESYAPARIMPMRTARRIGSLAACLCLLIGVAVLVRSGLFLAGSSATELAGNTGMKDSQTEAVVMTEEAAAEEAEMEEAVIEEEMVEEAMPADKDIGAYDYYIISSHDEVPEEENEVRQPENGEWVCEFGLRKRVMDIIRLQTTPTMAGSTGTKARFLAAFRLTRDGKPIDPDSEEYLTEVQRLVDLGYEFRTLYVEGKTKDIRVCICGLFTAEQLDEFTARAFDANEEYGYVFYFPTNEDGTPLDWENTAELIGLPTAQDVSVEE